MSSGSSSSRVGSGYPATAGLGDPDYARSRGNRPVSGSAVARPAGDYVSFPFFGPWGRWYPWYTGGFGWNLGFVTYNPWRYGATRWIWGRYGLWYDPWDYWLDPYWASSGYYRSEPSAPKPKSTIGSLRIKANPSSAKVYIDNALVGLVDEFDGLGDYLELEGGRHVLELRAEGYVTHTQDIEIKPGKTQTVRVSLKEKK